MSATDTIVAVSTPAGHAPRAVVRLSGPDAVPCVAERFIPRACLYGRWRRTYRATPGRYGVTPDGPAVPAVVYVMRGPHSYTCEDVVELHLPGAPALLDMVLDGFLSDGSPRVRLAEPGEFTRRAFLNGRIDLSQAEAVLALIRSSGEAELLAASRRLQGAAGRRCRALQGRVTELRVQVEAALNFAPHGIELISADEFLARCTEIRQGVQEDIGHGRDALASGGGFHVVIAGPPNAGKSSLMNRLAGSEVAIVHRRAGTTRDAVSGEIDLEGIRFRLADTAGLVPQASGPDAEAVRRARQLVGTCHLMLLVLDGSGPLPAETGELAGMVAPGRLICVMNKSDLPAALDADELREAVGPVETLQTSALTGQGVDELRAALVSAVAEGRLDGSPGECLFNARQRAAVRQAVEEMAQAEAAVREGLAYEFAAFNLREAAAALGGITGEVTPDDVLDGIFSRFCIGK